MPITLAQLAPFLTPYTPPGRAAAGIRALTDSMQQGRQLDQQKAAAAAQIQLGEQQLAEQHRKAVAEAAAAVAAEQQRIKEMKHKERVAVLGEMPSAIDPLKQSAWEAQARGAGFRVDPGMSTLEAPETQLQGPSDELDFSMAPPGLGMPSLELAPMAQAPQFVKQGEVSLDGKKVATYGPDSQRAEAERHVQEQFDAFLASSVDVDRPAAEQARAMIGPALQKHGYNAAAATSEIMNTYTVNANNATKRVNAAAVQAGSANRYGLGLGAREYKAGETAANTAFAAEETKTKVAAYENIKNSLNTIQTAGDNPTAWASVVYNLARSNDPRGALSNKDVGIAAGEGSIAEMTEQQLSQWFAGNRGPELRQRVASFLQVRMKQVLTDAITDYKQMRALRDQQPNDQRKAAIDATMTARYSGMPFYADARSQDTEHERLKGVQTPAGGAMGGSESSFEGARGMMALPQPQDSDNEWETVTP